MIHIAVNRLNCSYSGYIWNSLAFCCDHPIYCRSWVVQCISFLRTIKWLFDWCFMTWNYRPVTTNTRATTIYTHFQGMSMIVEDRFLFLHFLPIHLSTIYIRFYPSKWWVDGSPHKATWCMHTKVKMNRSLESNILKTVNTNWTSNLQWLQIWLEYWNAVEIFWWAIVIQRPWGQVSAGVVSIMAMLIEMFLFTFWFNQENKFWQPPNCLHILCIY